jgi:O-antigen ligase
MLVALGLVADVRARLAAALRSPLGVGVVVLLAALLIAAGTGIVTTGQPRLALHGLMDWRQLLLVPAGLALFDDRRWVERFALCWVVFAAVAATVALATWGIGYGRVEYLPGVVLRNNVTQSMVLASGMLVAGVLLATGQSGSVLIRLLLGAAIMVAALAMLLVQPGRSGFIALVVSAAVAAGLLARGRQRIVACAALAALAAAVYVASPTLQQRFELGLHEIRNVQSLPETSSMGIRVIIWQTTAQMIAERPLLGYGLGGLAPAYAQHIARKYADGWRSTPVADAHNQYLFVWVEAGAVGLAAFIAFLVAAVRQPAARPQRAIGLGLLAAWCATSLFSSHFQAFSEGHLIAVLLGVFLAGGAQGATSAASTASNTC